jgi:hypothetical protein
MERLKVTYYAKITGIQATSYETLAEIYKNKQSIEKAINAEKDAEILRLRSDRDCEKRLRKDAEDAREDATAFADQLRKQRAGLARLESLRAEVEKDAKDLEDHMDLIGLYGDGREQGKGSSVLARQIEASAKRLMGLSE